MSATSASPSSARHGPARMDGRAGPHAARRTRSRARARAARRPATPDLRLAAPARNRPRDGARPRRRQRRSVQSRRSHRHARHVAFARRRWRRRPPVGVACHLGRDRRRAELAALADALLQMPEHHAVLHQQLIEPFAAQQAAQRARSDDRTPRRRASNSSRWCGATDGKLDRLHCLTLIHRRVSRTRSTIRRRYSARLLDALSRPGTIGVDRRTCCLRVRAHAAPSWPRSPRCSRSATTRRPCGSRKPTPRWRSALRFHTGAPLVDEPAQAAFAYIHDADALPPLESFCARRRRIAGTFGHAADPRRSADGRRTGRAERPRHPAHRDDRAGRPARAFLARTRRARAALSVRRRLLSRLRRLADRPAAHNSKRR